MGTARTEGESILFQRSQRSIPSPVRPGIERAEPSATDDAGDPPRSGRCPAPHFLPQRIAIARALLKRPKILIFDEAVSNLDQQTAEHCARTINKLKGKVTMLFITHQIPRGLQVDEVFSFGSNNQHNTKVEVVGEQEQ